MSDADDLVMPLRAVVRRADATWVNQPSHLRRRLEDELGTDARRHRAQIHQLVVAAEERVPVRLRRNGWSPNERDELSKMLVSTRGWTPAAAIWAVTTWAAALELTDERPDGPLGEQRPTAAAASDERRIVPTVGPTVVPTVVPTDPAPTSGADGVGPTDLADLGSISGTVPRQVEDRTVRREPPHVPASGAPPAAAFSPPPPPPLSPSPAPALPPMTTKKPTKLTRRVGQFLGHDVDVAYDVAVGPNPALLLLATPIGLAGLVAPVLLSGPLLMLFTLIIIVGRLLWPSRLLAVRGDDVWLLRKSGNLTTKPAAVEVAGSRHDMVYAGRRPIPSVRFAGQRLWFLVPNTRVARQLTGGDSSRKAA